MLPCLGPTGEPQPASKKPKAETETGTDAESGPYVKISNALAKFFGVDERDMLVAEINKRIWEYINVNQLQVCDRICLSLYFSSKVPLSRNVSFGA